MTLALSPARDAILTRYHNLVQGEARILALVQNWMDEGVELYGVLTDAGEKQELQALKADMVAQLRAILNV